MISLKWKFPVLLPRKRSQVHFVGSHIKRTQRMNRRDKSGKENRKINRITVLYGRKHRDPFDHVRCNKHRLVVHMHKNNNTAEEWLSQNRVTVCGQGLFTFTLTLWLGRPGGTHEKPSEMLFSLEGLRCGSVGGLNPRRSRTLTHSSWYTSWASLGHLQLLHVFLKEQRKKLISRI
jgi:hypothetical protein